MPRPKKPTATSGGFDSTLATIVAEASRQIADAVRASITSEVARLVATKKPAASPAGKQAAKPGRKPKSRGGRRSPEQAKADVEKLYAFVKSNPGSNSEALQAGTKIAKQYVASGLLALRQAKKIKMAGQKRSATYSA